MRGPGGVKIKWQCLVIGKGYLGPRGVKNGAAGCRAAAYIGLIYYFSSDTLCDSLYACVSDVNHLRGITCVGAGSAARLRVSYVQFMSYSNAGGGAARGALQTLIAAGKVPVTFLVGVVGDVGQCLG